MKVFVTGGTGFVGSHLLSRAHALGIPVLALRRTEGSLPRIPLDHEPPWVTKGLADLEPADFQDCDTLIHLAAHSANLPYDTLENCLLANVVAPVAAFRAASAAGIRRFVIAGTCFEYGAAGDRYEEIPADCELRPVGSYPASKAAATSVFHALAAELEASMLILRIFQVYGPGEAPTRFWPSLMKAAWEGRDFEMSAGSQLRDFIHVGEVARAFLEAACRPQFPRSGVTIENLGSGHPMSLGDFATREWHAAGATGSLKLGAVPMRANERMRIVPKLPS